MIAVAAIRSSPSSPPRSLMLSAALHGLLLAAWIFAPAPALRDLGPGALTVELLMTPPPPEPEPQPERQPDPPPQTPAAPPRQAIAKPIASKPRPAPLQPVSAAAPVEAAAQPVLADTAAPALAPAVESAPAVAVAAPAGRSAERDDYVRMVWARIMRFRPERVPFAGTTRLRFTLTADGTLVAVELADSSGSGLLDRAALDAVRRAAPFPPPPPGVPADALTFEIPFQFR